jgi:hypothetical protein
MNAAFTVDEEDFLICEDISEFKLIYSTIYLAQKERVSADNINRGTNAVAHPASLVKIYKGG